MAILVGDANIFIDMEIGDLIRPMFRLDDVFAAPDVLYREELKEHHAELPGLGLCIERLSGAETIEVDRLSGIHTEPGKHDIFALALAKERGWTLLSGDRRLREAALVESVEIHGTIWLVERMIKSKVVSLETARFPRPGRDRRCIFLPLGRLLSCPYPTILPPSESNMAIPSVWRRAEIVLQAVTGFRRLTNVSPQQAARRLDIGIGAVRGK